MTTLSSVLKTEISRVTRKILRDELLALKKSSHAYRSEIAALKREVKELRAQLKAQGKVVKKVAPPQQEPAAEPGRRTRAFSHERFAAQRAKLDVSQAEMAKLLKCSALSVARWEAGKAVPRAAQAERIASLRGLGKREAAQRLATLD
jgi:ribosome-binding protein aMBF1 (putative translation factor)